MMFNRVTKVVIHNDPVGWCETCTRKGHTPLEYNGRVFLKYMRTVLGATVPTVLCPKCFVEFREAGEAHRPRVENCSPHPSEWGGVTPEWEHLHVTPNTSSNVTHMENVDAVRSRACMDALTPDITSTECTDSTRARAWRDAFTPTPTNPPLPPAHLRSVSVPIPTLTVQDDYRRYITGGWGTATRGNPPLRTSEAYCSLTPQEQLFVRTVIARHDIDD